MKQLQKGVALKNPINGKIELIVTVNLNTIVSNDVTNVTIPVAVDSVYTGEKNVVCSLNEERSSFVGSYDFDTKFQSSYTDDVDGVDKNEYIVVDFSHPVDSSKFSEILSSKQYTDRTMDVDEDVKFKYAGVELISAKFGSYIGKFYFQNQADIIYVSGHGSHFDGTVYGAGYDLIPGDIGNNWNYDVDMVILSACSVLDIGNKNFKLWTSDRAVGCNVPTGHNNCNPGLKWASVNGPKIFLGYNHTAPKDESGVSKEVVKRFFLYYKDGDLQSAIEAWRKAHPVKKSMTRNTWVKMKGPDAAMYNACVIEKIDDKKLKYYYYKLNFDAYNVIPENINCDWTSTEESIP